MADVIRKATNKFTKGLVMDFSPENTKNELLTHALNATLLTFNGNELSLQNDMGNARVETAYLPEGYMPVGTCEYGGIIYIVSYNPLEDKSQIGCFPSPERNISSDELGASDVVISKDAFQKSDKDGLTGEIKQTTQYVLLRNDNLNPGDKFLICSDKSLYNERLSDLWVDKDSSSSNFEYELISNPIIALNVVSIEDSGRIVYLNSDIRQYEVPNTWSETDSEGNTTTNNATFKYHILGTAGSGESFNQEAIDIDSYRNTLSSGYSVFRSKTSGKLAILAELITIDSYSVTHEVVPRKVGNTIVEGKFDVLIHTDVEPKVTSSNYNVVPKLRYYHLKDSQGYVQIADGNTVSLFGNSGNYNSEFFRVKLSDIYEPILDSLDLNKSLGQTGQFNFHVGDTYHGRMEPYEGELEGTVDHQYYTKFTEGSYHRLHSSQLNWDINKNYYINQVRAKFYKYNTTETGYQEWTEESVDETVEYYIQTITYNYIDAKRDAATYKDKGITLYKMTTQPQAASIDEIKNVLIEKYQYVEVHTYREATKSELEGGSVKLYEYDADSNKYTSITGEPDSGVTYYVLEIEYNLVSIGKDLSNETYQGEIYYFPSNKEYVEATISDLTTYWDFTNYPLEEDAPYGCPITLYEMRPEETYRLATETEKFNWKELNLVLYYDTAYSLVAYESIPAFQDSTSNQLFIVVPIDTYVSASTFEANSTYNYIAGYTKPSGEYPKDDPISLYALADFIPKNLDTPDVSLEYESLNLATVQIPPVLSVNGLDLPFKYSYTLTPCMNYGRLENLSISNTVDFGNLHAFNQSNFNEWRYHIDGNQLRLTFGAEIFDTYEDYKVDGLVLEFYDLWGFAGSLEIANRKSYSGVFTKLIPLNTIGGLNTNRIVDGKYDTNFKRNVNIYKDVENNVYKYLDTEVVYSNEEGWIGIEETDNDCGVLYSNLIYGVKAYIKRTTDVGMEFIHKKDYFLFTLPIYNDYYYSITDFSTLVNPKLEMQLTYKLVDSSTKTPYTNSDYAIAKGYNESDSSKISLFTSNSQDFTWDSLQVTKYYQYKGTSNLYLEVGLRDVYSNMNLQYDPEINKYFTCELQLAGEKLNENYTIQSQENSLLDESSILNYKHSDGSLPLTINKFGFTTSYESKLPVQNLMNKRFITFSGSDPITIHYEFVVGYAINMTDIVSKEFPITTVCALCHVLDSGEENLSDFNISKRDDNGTLRYMSDGIIYNAGTRSKRKIGVAAQQHVSGNAETQISSISQDFVEEGKEMSASKANSGEIMKQILPYIGKLSFCQPHAHAIYPNEGVSVHGNMKTYGGSYASEFTSRFNSGHEYYLIPPHHGGDKLHDSWADSYDNTWGSIPTSRMFEKPLYNMVLNTENSIKLQSEFISSMYHSVLTGKSALYASTSDGWMQWESCGDARQFVGLTGEQLSNFNEKLIETMRWVYAYNPDYNTYKHLSGNTVIDDLRVQVASNIVNNNSAFNFESGKSLNDFVCLGNVVISDYLNNLNTYSDINVKNSKGDWLDSLQFIYDMTYCGTDTSPYLLTSLTYNFPSDVNMNSDFSMSNTSTIVRMYDGTIIPISGTVNPNSLYGYNKDTNCLWMLDVSNYTINYKGELSCSQTSLLKENSIVTGSKSYSWASLKATGYTTSYNSQCFRGTTLTINDLVYQPNDEHRLYIRNGCYQYNSKYRSKLFYGTSTVYLVDYKAGKWYNFGNTSGDWSMGDVEKNVMYIANGPGFNPNTV